MIGLVLAAAALSIATLALVLWPLLRRWTDARAPGRGEFDIRVYRDQLAEVDRDLRRAALRAEDAEAARAEVKRRLLAAADAAERTTSTDAEAAPEPARRHGPLALAAALAVLLPAGAGVLYATLGAPGSPDRPLADRQAAESLVDSGDAGGSASLAQAASQLAKRLQARPDDAGGWFLLGRAYLTLERPREAADALRQAAALAPDQPEVAAAYAEAAIAAAGGRITEEVRTALLRLLSLDPFSPQARFLLALDRAQQGDLRAAVQGWTDLLALAPPDAPWVTTVRTQIDQVARQAALDPASVKPSAEVRALAEQAAEQEKDAANAVPAGPGPSAEEMAAAQQMSPEARSEMIRGMVDRLATRLQENPDDIEGWRRLARAYDMLGESEKASRARARIAALEGR